MSGIYRQTNRARGSGRVPGGELSRLLTGEQRQRLAGRPLATARRAGRGLAALAMDYGGLRRRVVRTLLFHAVGRVTPLVAVETDGVRLLLETADLGPGRLMFTRGELEAGTLETALGATSLSREDLSDRVFVDVGANVGSASVLALGRYGFGSAIAIEPDARNAALVRANLAINGLEGRCNLVVAAAGRGEGEAELEISPDNFGDHRIRNPQAGPGEFREETRAGQPVRMRTLDSILADAGLSADRVGLLWVDVQGFEAQVLEGATGLLKESTPVVIEFWPYALRRSGDLERLCDLAESHFDRFLDLRRAADGGLPWEPVGRLRTFHPAPDGSGQAIDATDLLFVSDGPA